jgi:multidrug efflux pump subunit AcrB
MTAFTFILGVLPMLFVSGAGAQSQISMGTSVFFGMLFATMIGIIFVPVLFMIFDILADRFSSKKTVVRRKYAK